VYKRVNDGLAFTQSRKKCCHPSRTSGPLSYEGGRNTQAEVVLNVGELHEKDVWTLGGWSSSFDALVAQAFMHIQGRRPTNAEFIDFLSQMDELSPEAGARWLAPESTTRVMNRIRPAADVLFAIKRAQLEEREAAEKI
jgi:hypothetical protein